MKAPELVNDKAAFLSLRQQCERIIDSQKRLPDFVFRRAFGRYFAIEYSQIYRKEFGLFLQKLSRILGDDAVNYMTEDPIAGDEYYQHSAFFGATSFKPSELNERYSAVMHPVEGASTILAGANVGVFWGSTLKWGIIGDRVSWELALIALPEDIDIAKLSDFRCMDAPALRQYVKSQYHAKDPSDGMATTFAERFLANYSI